MVLAESNLALIQIDRGDGEAVAASVRHAQQRGQELNDMYMLGTGNHALAYYHVAREEWEQAEELMDAVALALKKSQSRVVPLNYFGLYSLILLHRSRLGEAEGIIQNNLVMAREARSAHFEGEDTRVLAQIRSAQGRRDEAFALFEQAIATFERLGSYLELGKTLFYLGEAQVDWGEDQAARQSLDRARQIFEECNAGLWLQKVIELGNGDGR
jgi:tetratricopeptide (TPR) repeat protein